MRIERGRTKYFAENVIEVHHDMGRDLWRAPATHYALSDVAFASVNVERVTKVRGLSVLSNNACQYVNMHMKYAYRIIS